jgi:hypothetical protein
MIAIRSVSTLSLVCFVPFCLLGCGSGTTWSNDTKDLIATAYAGAFSYPEKFPDWAGQNKSALASEQFRTCLDHMANQLTRAALSAPSYDDVYSRSMDIASRAGAPELGSKVAEDMSKTSGDLLQLAALLRQLMTCIESGVNDDWTRFSQSDFQAMAYVLGMSEQQLGSDYTRRLREVSFELHRWYLLSLAGQMK